MTKDLYGVSIGTGNLPIIRAKSGLDRLATAASVTGRIIGALDEASSKHDLVRAFNDLNNGMSQYNFSNPAYEGIDLPTQYENLVNQVREQRSFTPKDEASFNRFVQENKESFIKKGASVNVNIASLGLSKAVEEAKTAALRSKSLGKSFDEVLQNYLSTIQNIIPEEMSAKNKREVIEKLSAELAADFRTAVDTGKYITDPEKNISKFKKIPDDKKDAAYLAAKASKEASREQEYTQKAINMTATRADLGKLRPEEVNFVRVLQGEQKGLGVVNSAYWSKAKPATKQKIADKVWEIRQFGNIDNWNNPDVRTKMAKYLEDFGYHSTTVKGLATNIMRNPILMESELGAENLKAFASFYGTRGTVNSLLDKKGAKDFIQLGAAYQVSEATGEPIAQVLDKLVQQRTDKAYGELVFERNKAMREYFEGKDPSKLSASTSVNFTDVGDNWKANFESIIDDIDTDDEKNAFFFGQPKFADDLTKRTFENKVKSLTMLYVELYNGDFAKALEKAGEEARKSVHVSEHRGKKVYVVDGIATQYERKNNTTINYEQASQLEKYAKANVFEQLNPLLRNQRGLREPSQIFFKKDANGGPNLFDAYYYTPAGIPTRLSDFQGTTVKSEINLASAFDDLLPAAKAYSRKDALDHAPVFSMKGKGSTGRIPEIPKEMITTEAFAKMYLSTGGVSFPTRDGVSPTPETRGFVPIEDYMAAASRRIKGFDKNQLGFISDIALYKDDGQEMGTQSVVDQNVDKLFGFMSTGPTGNVLSTNSYIELDLLKHKNVLMDKPTLKYAVAFRELGYNQDFVESFVYSVHKLREQFGTGSTPSFISEVGGLVLQRGKNLITKKNLETYMLNTLNTASKTDKLSGQKTYDSSRFASGGLYTRNK